MIALAVARRVIDAGGRVVLGDLKDAASAVEALGESARFVAGDVTDDEYLDSLVETCVGEFGGVDGLVHAAVTFDDATYDTTRQEWRNTANAWLTLS